MFKETPLKIIGAKMRTNKLFNSFGNLAFNIQHSSTLLNEVHCHRENVNRTQDYFRAQKFKFWASVNDVTA